MRYLKSMMAVAACALAIGTAHASPAPKPTPKTGTLIVYRKWNLSGSGGKIWIYINGQDYGNIRNGYYFKVPLAPGDYTVGYKIGWGSWQGLGGSAPMDPQIVHVVADQTIYFCCFANSLWFVFEVADDQDGARQSVSHLKEQN